MIRQLCLIAGIILSFAITSGCKKLDIIQHSEEELFNKTKFFLKSKQQTESTKRAQKIQNIIENLSKKNIIVIGTYKENEAIVCDLSSYKNYTSNKFKNVFYKVIFQLRDSEISDAFIYTIHTNENESYLNQNIERILKGKDVRFNGEITSNALDDKYLITKTFSKGKLESTKELQINISKDRNHFSGQKAVFNIKNSNESNIISCVDWYEVTTYYYSDGRIEQTWNFLRRTCTSSCGYGNPNEVQNFCDDEGLGGGGGGGNAADSTNPCNTADTLSTNLDFKRRMDSLKALTNQNFETGYYSVKNPNGTFTYTKNQGSSGSASIFQNITTPISSYMHNHYTGLLSVFSGSDIRQMFEWFRTGKLSDVSTFTMSLVTASGTTYMMQNDDIMKFQQFGQTWMSDDLTFVLFESQYLNRFNISQTGSNSNNLIGFLRMLGEFNTGIKFFEGNNSTFSEWSPIKFESDGTENGGTIVNSPC